MYGSKRNRNKHESSVSSSWSDVFWMQHEQKKRKERRRERDSVDGDVLLRQGCDRRLSRAARFIIQGLLRDFLSLDENDEFRKKLDLEKMNVWQLLQSVLVSNNNNQENDEERKKHCPLWPEKDIFRKDEESGVQLLDSRQMRDLWKLGTSRSSLQGLMIQLPPRGYTYNSNFYQCLYCRKIFTTRYYLDYHLEQRHSSQLNSTSNNDDSNICPAQDWCIFLPTGLCQETALQMEPYYDRGSEGRRDTDRSRVAHKLWKQAHEFRCTHESILLAQQKCQQVIDSCFRWGHNKNSETQLDSLRLFWETRVCQRIACSNVLHRWYFAARQEGAAVLRQVHEWQDHWSLSSSEKITQSTLAYLCFGLVFCYAFLYWRFRFSGERFLGYVVRRNPHKAKARLLRMAKSNTISRKRCLSASTKAKHD